MKTLNTFIPHKLYMESNFKHTKVKALMILYINTTKQIKLCKHLDRYINMYKTFEYTLELISIFSE